MYFPQFLIGMLTTSGIVAFWSYVATGSIWQASGWTVIAAVLLQVAYFVLATWLVSRRRDLEKTGADKDTARQSVSPTRSTRNKDGLSH
ncbi:hypothetical protein [Mesorhizobium sp. B1-1-8]|uniref:hypothetical protein n=1 Tax=Mesorhizobium sp. B1-1-8 TaxID=2589976 RepID=UPI00112836FC|nr:hypothetical protein [Mesorhizobium sp. B1-1-8]UCI10499.1 hypothetical protein FJ974_29805 [Mesorhizobium sp. B1-1-8]